MLHCMYNIIIMFLNRSLLLLLLVLFFSNINMQDMGSSACLKILEQHSEDVQHAIQTEFTLLVGKLVEEGIVERAIGDRLLKDPTTVSDTAGNARRLFTVIKGRVGQNSAHFKTFVEVLKESNLTELAQNLENAHGRLDWYTN